MRVINAGLLCFLVVMTMTSLALDTDDNSPAVFPGVPPLLQTEYQQLPSNETISSYLKQWADYSKKAIYIQIGESAGGRPISGLMISRDEELLSANQKKETSVKLTKTSESNQEERLRVMIVGGQHGNESAGPEAIQKIIYEILSGSLSYYPEKIDLMLIPNASPDGRDLMSRENANGVNTNTDYISMSQPESRALREALLAWQPHTVIDVHESKAYKEESLALQGYVTVFEIQYEVGFEPNINADLREFGVKEFFPELIKKVKDQRLLATRYIKEIVDVNLPVTHGGITLRNFRNYAGFHHSFSILVEGRLDPPDNTYPTPLNIQNRTDELYISIEAYLQRVNETADKIKTLTNRAKQEAKRSISKKPLILESEYRVDPYQPTINIPLLDIRSNRIVEHEFNYHSQVVVNKSMTMPQAYVVTRNQDRIADLLTKHGIVSSKVNKGFQYKGVKRRISQLKVVPPLRGRGRYDVNFEMVEEEEEIHVQSGDLWIELAQPNGRLVPLLLEPSSTSTIFDEGKYVDMLSEGSFFLLEIKSQPVPFKGIKN